MKSRVAIVLIALMLLTSNLLAQGTKPAPAATPPKETVKENTEDKRDALSKKLRERRDELKQEKAKPKDTSHEHSGQAQKPTKF